MKVTAAEIILVGQDETVLSKEREVVPAASERPVSIYGHLKRVRKPRVHITLDALPAVEHMVTIATPAATALIGAWLQSRLGRKVRIKMGDIEAEAATVEDVERLLDRVTKPKQETHGGLLED